MKLPTMKTHQAETAFIRAGYKLIRMTGNHRILSDGEHVIELSHNTNRPMSPILLGKLLKRIGMTPDRFMECLR